MFIPTDVPVNCVCIYWYIVDEDNTDDFTRIIHCAKHIYASWEISMPVS